MKTIYTIFSIVGWAWGAAFLVFMTFKLWRQRRVHHVPGFEVDHSR